jgi:NAD(P)-dependent dehydrogenase (short-subunit alcohol dehydrogenase family)
VHRLPGGREPLTVVRSAVTGPIVLVTGASRGIGAEVCRQLVARGCTVIGSAREPSQVAHGEPLALDVESSASVAAAAAELRERYGRLDALVNNAAIVLDQGEPITGLEAVTLRRTLETNLVGPLRVTRAFWSLLGPADGKPGGRVVMVSSMSGQLGEVEVWAPAYGISKTALNALTVQLAAAGRARSIAVNCVCPGWVRTDMGGPSAPRSVDEGAKGIVWLVLDAPAGLTGTFTRDGKPLAW